MKRSFPRAVTEVVGLVGLLVLANVGCSPDNDVKPGAPVLTMMSIVEPDGTRFDVTPAATSCEPAVADGESCDPDADGICHTADFLWCKCVPVPPPAAPETPPCTPDEGDAGATDAAADGGADGSVDAAAGDAAAATDAGASDAGASDASASDAGASDAGASDAGASDAGEVAAPKGTWSCKAFAPQSVVIATFDRLIDTAPLGPQDGSTDRDDVATATIKTAVTPVPTTSTNYTPNGSTGGLIFPLFGENPGPNLKVTAQPSWPASNVVTVALSKARVLAKDGKTPFASSGGIIDGIVSFKTVEFSASIAVPPNAFPPPEETDAGTDGGDASADASSDPSDASSDAGADAETNPDACVPPPPPPPEPTTALADMTPVVISFNAPVDPATITSHVTITVGGKSYADQVDITADATTVTITPKTHWAASTTFDIAVDDKAVDVFGNKIGGATGMFTTGDK
jgi:hypothetical protein